MRWAVAGCLLLAMFVFGIGVYHTVGYLKGDRNVVHRPNEVSAPPLAGTMYVVQAGAIYRFHHGSFTQITPEAGWTQPSAGPGDQLFAVSTGRLKADVPVSVMGALAAEVVAEAIVRGVMAAKSVPGWPAAADIG